MSNQYEPLNSKYFFDPNIASNILAVADSSKEKINFSLGSLFDENGKCYRFRSVLKAENLVLNDPERVESYLYILGDDEFCSTSRSLLLPDTTPELRSQFVSIQTLGSTGGIYLTLKFFSNLKNRPTVHIFYPTWDNYFNIASETGLEFKKYPYLLKETSRIDIDSILLNLKNANEGDLVILQVSGHNPTGTDFSEDEWQKVLKVVQERQLVVLMDLCYHGLVRDLNSDVYPCSLFSKADPPVELFISQSYSKTMGLYSGRIGCLHFKTTHNREALRKEFARLVRTDYSSPPRHYAAIVKTVLTTPELRDEWLEELNVACEGLKRIRAKLTDRIVAKLGNKWNFIAKQAGLFVYLNISEDLVEKLREKHIHMSSGGRIVLPVLNDNNIDEFVEKLSTVLKDV